MARKKKLPEGMTLRGKVYYAAFRAHGRQIRKRLSSDFDEACRLLRHLRAKADREEFGLTDNDYSWDELKKEFLRWARQSVRNPQEYEADLAKFEEYRKVRTVRQIDHDYVLGFREWRLAGGHGHGHARGVTPRTVNRQVGTLMNMLNKAVAWRRIAHNPIADIKPLRHDSPAKERRALSVEEVEALFAASPERLRVIWRFFMVTGVRRDELVEMTFDDIDFERQVVTVRRVVSKSHKEREIPLDDETLATLRHLQETAQHRKPVKGKTPYLTERQKANFSKRHVFVTQANTPWHNNLLTRFYTYCRRAGIEDGCKGGSVDIHSLRVSFVTLSLEHGAKPKAVQEIVGHSTLSLTMNIYARATDKAKREAIGALPFARTSTPPHVVSLDEHKAYPSNSDESQPDEKKRVRKTS